MRCQLRAASCQENSKSVCIFPKLEAGSWKLGFSCLLLFAFRTTYLNRLYQHPGCAFSLCTDIWPLAPTTTLMTSHRGEMRMIRALAAHVPAPYAHPTPPALIHASASGRLKAMSICVVGYTSTHVAASCPCGEQSPAILKPLRIVYSGETVSFEPKKPSLSTSAKNS